MYQLNLLESPRKFLKKLRDKKLRLYICAKFEDLKGNPFPINSKKLKENLGYRIRIGDYRVLYTVDFKSNVIAIFKIGHRKDIYR